MKYYSFISKLLEIFELLSTNSSLKKYKDKNEVEILSGKNTLLKINKNEIITSVPNFFQGFNKYKSKLNYEFKDLKSLGKLIEKLTARNNIVRLNHIGFCYKSDSIAVEKSKLIKSCLENKLHLYEEDSSDETRWYFIGNIKNDWQIPLIEYLLLEQTDDAWKDYWLPHVQIDIDTNLSDKEIEKELKVFFNFFVG